MTKPRVQRTQLTQFTTTELAGVLARREVSPLEVVDAYVDRIQAVGSRINAVVTLRAEEARAEAVAAERALQSGSAGPLCGVPFTVKDVLATEGVRTTCGSRLFADFVPRHDAPCVARLTAAGGIFLGKTNCSEFALDPYTDNLVFGPTLNPWNPALTPGGSSGGESSAIAAGLSPLGLGTDYGGSLRWPAHCTGITTIRPTAGLVPRTGILPSTSPYDPPPPNALSFRGQVHVIGPLARSADDLALALNILAGPDGIDPFAVPVSVQRPEDVDVRSLTYVWCEGDGSYPVRDDVVAVVEMAARRLEGLGLHVVHRRPRPLERAEDLYARIRAIDGLADLREMVGDRLRELSPIIRTAVDSGRVGTIPVLLAASDEREALRAELLAYMRDHHILLLPVASLPAYPRDQRTLDVDGREISFWQVLACSRAISLFGLPAAAVPCGWSNERLPVSVQIVGAPFMDDVVLAVARLLECEFGRFECPMLAEDRD